MPTAEEYIGENLGAKKVRRKRSKLALLLLPIIVFIFFMGWSMYWIGDKKRPKANKRKVPKEDGVTFLPAVSEETPKIPNEK